LFGSDTHMVLYQVDENTLQGVWESTFPMQLSRSGDAWLWGGFSEDGFSISEFGISFPTASTLSGGALLDVTTPGFAGSYRVTFQLSRDNCTALDANPSVISGLGGNEGSSRCFSLTLPACVTDFSVSMTGGSGDADLIVGQTAPPFDAYESFNFDNQESLSPPPSSGDWFVIVEGYEQYAGATLTTQYNEPDADRDGVADCIDLCATTPAAADVDAQGCAFEQRDDDGDTVLNTLDNCPADANADQADNDSDGEGDACDNDDDNDRLSDDDERNLYGTDPLSADTDRDGVDDGDEIDAGSNPLLNPVVPVVIINQMLLDE
jgi:hypothetical protein